MSNKRRCSSHTAGSRTMNRSLSVVPPRPPHPSEPPAPPGGAETIVGLIATSGLDDDLALLSQAIHRRRRDLAQAQSVRALGSLGVGDRVRVNRQVSPRYLQGSIGTVAGWSGQRVVVLLDEPIGRFTNGELRCPPLGLDRL